jgi:protein involved in polysaccharide export with SLBB domain
VDPDVYRVGPGDIFRLNLSGRISESTLLTVDAEGFIFVPTVGGARVDGLTLTEARKRVLTMLQEHFRGVRTDFHLARVRYIWVQLTGDVARPGPIQIPATSRVSEAVTRDVVLEGASRRNVQVRRRDGTEDIADIELFERTGNRTLNPLLENDDIIIVPAATEFVQIYGAVARPGRWEKGPEDSLHTLIRLAGGPLPSALVDRCLLVRWRTPTESDSVFFNLEDSYSGALAPRLQDGDRVYIYFTSLFHEMQQAAIYGEVLRPGSYPLQTGLTRLSDLVEYAGGFRERADLTTIRVYRVKAATPESDPEFERLARLSRAEMTDSEYEVLRTRQTASRSDFRVDWERLMTSPELDVILRDGDVVRVDPLIASVRVEGEVRRPGVVSFETERAVQDYVELAGGFAKKAARGKILITKAVTGQTLRARDVSDVAPGDLIWVPEKKDRDFWLIFRDVVAVAGQVAVIVLATRK